MSCELSDWKAYHALAALAAAYAEAGQFDKAVERQQKAIDLVPEDEKRDLEPLLKLFQAKKPYRDEPRKRARPGDNWPPRSLPP